MDRTSNFAAVISILLGTAASAAPPSWSARGDEIVLHVRSSFFDQTRAKEWHARHSGYAVNVKSEEEFVSRTQEVLRDLHASHTGYYTKDSARYYGLSAIFGASLRDPHGDEPKPARIEWDSPGADFTDDGFVRVVFANGPTEKAGLHRGDKILAVDGSPFKPVASFRDRSGKPLKLTVQRIERSPPIQLSLTPRRINPKEEWLEHQRKGATIFKRNGKKVAYAPMFSGAGEEYQQALQNLIARTFRGADALVIDFRDGFGGCSPDFVNIFNKAPPVLAYQREGGKASTYDPQWRKPVVFLINEGTTSGKEMVVYSVKKQKIGALVGKRTAGALLAGTGIPLCDGSLLYLAVSDVRVDGVRLEGVGVEPDVEVADRLPFADGADPQLQKAIEIATK